MKQKNTSRLLFVLLAGFLLGNISCSKFDELKSPVDGFKVILNYDIFDTFITIRLIDAPSGELIGAVDDEKVEVNISGNGADAVVDQVGNHYTVFNSVYGIINLALNPKNPWVPSENNVLALHFTTENENYISSELKINVDSVGNYSYDVYLEPNNSEKLGIKEYTYFSKLNSNNELINDFEFSSTAEEISFKIPAGTSFTNNENEQVTGENIKINVKYFLNSSKAPVPKGLINNLTAINGSVSKKAIDFYQIAEIVISDENGNEITANSDDIVIKLRITANQYNPLKKKKLSVNDAIYSLWYNTEEKCWYENEKTVLKSDSLGFFGELKYTNSRYLAFANSVNTCSLASSFEFNFTNQFEELPVGARVNIYRKYDNRYIGNKTLQIDNDKQILDAQFTSIENEQVKFYVYNSSSNNPFTVATPSYYSDTSCGNIDQPFSVDITSQRTQINGQLKINTSNNLPEQGLEVYAEFYKSSNNSRLFRKKIQITPIQNVFTLATGIVAGVDVYLKIIPVDSQFSLETTPTKIPFNTSTGPFNWNFDLTFEDRTKEFIFDFDIDGSFGDRELTVRADFLNLKTNSIDESITLNVSGKNPTVTKKLILEKNGNYRIKIKRPEGKEPFMAYPFEKEITALENKLYTIETELLPTDKKEVTANIKLLCGSSVIYPTISGMFRTVWEDKWQSIEIKEGYFKQEFEIGGTYEIGAILDGVLNTAIYKIDETVFDMEIEVKGSFCDSMGW